MSIQVTQLSILKLLEGKNILNSKYIQNCSIETTPASKSKEHLLFQSPPSQGNRKRNTLFSTRNTNAYSIYAYILSQISERTPNCILNSQINDQLFNVLE